MDAVLPKCCPFYTSVRQLMTVAILKKKCTINFIAYYAGVLRVPGMH